MKKLSINKKNLTLLLSNLKYEDNQELIEFCKNNSIEDLINTCIKFKKTTVFLGEDNGFPIGIGGVCPMEFNSKIAQVWLLCSYKQKFYKKEIYKVIKNKTEEFKNQYEYLFNQIYKSNFKALKWIKRLGFKTRKINDDYKLIYFKKEN